MWSPTAYAAESLTDTVVVPSPSLTNICVAGVPCETTKPNSPARPEDAEIDSVAYDDVAANDATETASAPMMPNRARIRAFLWLIAESLNVTVAPPRATK